jgi:hypothetical protein
VKRVDRVAREAPELLPKVAAGEMSVKQALRLVVQRRDGTPALSDPPSAPVRLSDDSFSLEQARHRLERLVEGEWQKWPRERRATFLHTLQLKLHRLIDEHTGTTTRPLSRGNETREAVGSH